MQKATVIGAGVSGLSSALNLQLAGFEVRILTRDLPQVTASAAAGAVWSGGSVAGCSRRWADHSLAHFLGLAKQADSGVGLRRMRQVFPEQVGLPWFKDKLPFFAKMRPEELPSDARDGWIMDVPIVAPPRYLQNLQEQFLEAGGKLEVRDVASLDGLGDEGRLLVNCTGAWAKYVTPDPDVFPIRGQTLLVEAPQIRSGTMRARDDTYLFPRDDGILLGGIYQYNSWRPEVDGAQSRDILERCSQIEPAVTDAAIIRTAVGIRPGRAAVRLEVEKRSDEWTVIHNYGHGSIGFTLSWGCALEVLALARNLSNR
ncbi:MAG: FAD-dependent oxidoreductase [Chloroflexi bacterium]|nr:FAD-dependent oxidoreductase [Chloroflexota bacterium]